MNKKEGLAALPIGKLIRLKEPISVSREIAQQMNLRAMTKNMAKYGLVPAGTLETLSDGLKAGLENVPDEQKMHIIISPRGLLEVVTDFKGNGVPVRRKTGVGTGFGPLNANNL